MSELSSLKSIDEDAILSNTRLRYENGFIYTRSGRLLLAVNPYQHLPLYTPNVLDAYMASLQPQADLPPHVYAVAASAHLGMMQNSMSQVRTQCNIFWCLVDLYTLLHAKSSKLREDLLLLHATDHIIIWHFLASFLPLKKARCEHVAS